jgi:hypothetical protein
VRTGCLPYGEKKDGAVWGAIARFFDQPPDLSRFSQSDPFFPLWRRMTGAYKSRPTAAAVIAEVDAIAGRVLTPAHFAHFKQLIDRNGNEPVVPPEPVNDNVFAEMAMAAAAFASARIVLGEIIERGMVEGVIRSVESVRVWLDRRELKCLTAVELDALAREIVEPTGRGHPGIAARYLEDPEAPPPPPEDTMTAPERGPPMVSQTGTGRPERIHEEAPAD